jgi:hypothetical protein
MIAFDEFKNSIAVKVAGLLAAQEPTGSANFGFLEDPSVGKWFFAGVFALLIVWLLILPAQRLGYTKELPPWWRNVRVWGVLVATTQMLVYILWK